MRSHDLKIGSSKLISLELPYMEDDRFDGISLTKMLVRFRRNVMYLWYGLLMRQRILVYGLSPELVSKTTLSLVRGGGCCRVC